MKRNTSARVAGVTFLLYIVVGITMIVVERGAMRGESTAAKLASIAQHAPQMRLNLILGLLLCFNAITLAVALYGITRDEDHELAVLAMSCRIIEGALGVMSTVATLGLLSLATTAAAAPGASGTYAVAEFLIKVGGWNPGLSGMFFAVGSTLFCYLLLRGRIIPVALAWLGVVASVLLVVLLPAQLAGYVTGLVTQLMWLPIAAFEIPLALWLLIKGVNAPAASPQRI